VRPELGMVVCVWDSSVVEVEAGGPCSSLSPPSFFPLSPLLFLPDEKSLIPALAMVKPLLTLDHMGFSSFVGFCSAPTQRHSGGSTSEECSHAAMLGQRRRKSASCLPVTGLGPELGDLEESV